MPDLSQEWGGDLSLTSTGGLALTDGLDLTRQRLLRRLFTNPGSYIWEPGYGAGLGRFIGRPKDTAAIRAVILEQATQEETVTSVTSVTVQFDGTSSLSLTLAYECSASPGDTQVLSLAVTPTSQQVI